MATAATFLTTSFTSVSSLDTGRIGYFVAWGGSEDGYAYTYSTSGSPPSGVTVSSNGGILTFATTVAAGTYNFNVVATNREDTSAIATFPYTLTVLEGVTSARSGTKVLHKTYDPADSGSFGSPTGSDYTSVLAAINTAILADQATNLDANGVETQLRCTIPFAKGTTYNYTNNHWLTGVQYYDVTATGSGAAPILQNNSASATFYEAGPLNAGNSGSMNRGGSRKANAALIATVAAGSSTVTCLTHAQTSRLVVGRWHMIVGSSIQVGGEPPNCMFVDYAIVTAVNATTGVVTLDRQLKFAYDQTWYEDIADDISFGRAWICPADTDSDGRATLRGRFTGINFQANPHATGGDPKNIMLLQSHIQSDFDTCTVQNYQPTMGKHYGVFGGSIAASCEPDKLSEMLFLSGTTTGQVGGGTGFQYILSLSSTHTNDGVNPDTIQIAPRQFRSSGSTFNAGTSTTPPYTFAYNGPNWYVNFKSTVFTGSVGNSWTYTGAAFSPLTIGSTASTQGVWSGSQLRIATTVPQFQDWLINSYADGIVAVNGLGPITANWGYIASVTSDQASGALWLNIVWVNGTKPLSGTIDIVGARMRRLFIESTCSFTGSMTYADAKFASQQAAPFETNWSYPAGYPFGGGTPVNISSRLRTQAQMHFGPLSVVNSPILNVSSSMKAVSKIKPGNLTVQTNSSTLTLTIVSCTATIITTPAQ